MERMCGSIGLSLVLLYLATWLVYLLGGNGRGSPMASAPFLAISAVCVLLAIASRGDILRLFRSLRVRRAVLGYGFLLVWTLSILTMIRVYSGGGWAGDWAEHFQRTLFFLDRLPTGTPIVGGYQLPARPPMMNVLAAFILAQTEDRFELYQVTFAFLNVLVFLPCCLILPALSGARRVRVLPLVALFALNPVIMQNATYTWTKALASFFVVLGLAFYLSGWRRRDHGRIVAAFVALAAGLLVHYSAGPYVVFLTLHYLLRLFWSRPARWRELATIAAASSMLLATWFAWSLPAYGTKGTFLSNTSVTASQAYQGSNVQKVGANLWDSIVPALARDPSLMDMFGQQSAEGWLRDTAFMFYQTSIIFNMGLVGGPVAVWLLFRYALGRGRSRSPESTFWLVMVPFCCIVGIAVIGERDRFGSAHVTLLTMAALGLSLLAGAWSSRKSVAWLLLVGCLADFSAGVLLHARVQSLENREGHVVFQGLEFSNRTLHPAAQGRAFLSSSAWVNWFTKHKHALTTEWVQELPARYAGDLQFQQLWPGFQQALLKIQDEDGVYWGGWFSRHDGQMTYIGDHVAGRFGGVIGTAVLLVLAGGLVTAAIHQIRAAPAVVLPAQVRPRPTETRSRRRQAARKRASGRR